METDHELSSLMPSGRPVSLTLSPFANRVVGELSWVIDYVRIQNPEKILLAATEGHVKAGELLAIMGPSGSGKSTLLNALANRPSGKGIETSGLLTFNRAVPDVKTIQKLSTYVEQEDNLIGSLSVRETIDFAARLSFPSTYSSAERTRHVDDLIDSFGLRDVADSLIGTPLRKGISGGQKRRVSVASQLVTRPKILFLDEPTTGLDSASSYQVVKFLKSVAQKYGLIVVASIHQPSTKTFNLFDKLLLLSNGQTCYFGTVDHSRTYFSHIGLPMPSHTNPAEYLLDLINADFFTNKDARIRAHVESSSNTIESAPRHSHEHDSRLRVRVIVNRWTHSPEARELQRYLPKAGGNMSFSHPTETGGPNRLRIPLTLVQRSFVKSYRDVIAYGIRYVMYVGLAIMMGTVWLRLDTSQQSIQPFINALFFGSAFMSFMAVAYVPAFLEDRATFVKERQNGLYGPTAFLIANFLIGLPYLFGISVLFSTIAYWLSNFNPTAISFFTWVMWLFLDLVAAESLVVLVSSIFPNFVVSLALTAFANGLWMSVGGFLVTPTVLNVFWKYVFHYIDYQTYVFQGMMVNEFEHRTYTCGSDCHCMYASELANQCKIAGTAVLKQYDYSTGKTGAWVGIMISIIVVYRLLGWVVTFLKRT